MAMTVICPICENRQEVTPNAGEIGVSQTSCTNCQANLVVPVPASQEICARRQGSIPHAQRVATTPPKGHGQNRIGMAFSVGLCLLLYTVVGFGGYSSLQGWKSSEPYQMSEAYVRGNPQIQRLVGNEMEFDWFPNCAGVPHLGGWGCEQGTVCCSPGAMMAVDETPSTGPCGVQDAVPFGVGDAVPAENPRARSS